MRSGGRVVVARASAEAAKLQLTETRTQLAEAEKGFREKEALGRRLRPIPGRMH